MLLPKVSDCQKKCSSLEHSVMKFDRSIKFLSIFVGNIYFAGDGINK